jgi:hypothetical protein
MKFFFLKGKRYKVILSELSRISGEAAVSLAVVKRWFQHFKPGNFSLNDETHQDDR